MATAARKKAGKAINPVQKPVPAQERMADKPPPPPTEWIVVLAQVPTGILIAEQQRRIALNAEVEKIPQYILDAEIARRDVPFVWDPDKAIL